jgi:hypothetical protein
MRAFICDYAKISPDVLVNLVTTKILGAWGAYVDIDENRFELHVLEPFKTVKVDWTQAREVISPYLYTGE